MVSVQRNDYRKHYEAEYRWLISCKQILEKNTDVESIESISWAAYHVENQKCQDRFVTTSALLLLIHDSAHTVAMIRHSFVVVRSAVECVNPGQTPVLTFYQPLFALVNKIKWTWTDRYGEKSLVFCSVAWTLR